MSAPAALPLFGDAYLADTQHLTLEEHGAYFKLLIICWRTEACELPADPKRIATMLGISAGKWAKLSPAVMAFWTRSETGWFQKRLTKERAFVDGKIAKNTLAANARWAGKPLETNKVDDADAYAPAMPLTPPPIKKEERVSDANASSPQPMAGAVFEYPESFELFGKTFPNRVGKRSAFKAWQAARKRLGGGIQATARLQTAVEAYAASVARAPPDHSSRRLHPATWLNEGRYDDPIEEISNVRSMGGNNGAGSAVVQRGNFGAAQRLGERHGTRAAAG